MKMIFIIRMIKIMIEMMKIEMLMIEMIDY